MVTKTIDLQKAQPQLNELVPLLTTGTEIILTLGNTPVARLVPLSASNAARISGLHAGSV
jgi:antitoxin (DNA-binding transcriptional repressor) of toxin-antitoxin stability system